MTDPLGGPYDLIWSGGAIYGPGIQTALAAWRRKLASGGRVAFTDLVLRNAEVSPELADFLATEGVPLRTEADLRADVAGAGWRSTAGFWLPDHAWSEYYLPLEARLDALAQIPEMAECVAGFRHEIAIWRQHGADYGYFLMVVVPQ